MPRMILVCLGVTTAALMAAGESQPDKLVQWSIADGGNGHFYEHVDAGRPISWHEARRLAGARTHQGIAGSLLTITSAQELDFVANQLFNPDGLDWLGGVQDASAPDYGEPTGGWGWITGEPWAFTAWSTRDWGGNDDEPNDHGGGEDFLSTETSTKDGNRVLRWNDFPASQLLNGFYVEYDASN